MVDLSVNIGSLNLKNPVMNCAGTFESGKPYSDFVDVSKLGAVVTKGMSLEPWEGNPAPRMAEICGGMLNCIGLQNPGVDAWIENDYPWLKEKGAKIITNIVGKNRGEYISVIEKLEDLDIDAYEVNISCPNVSCGGSSFASDAKLASDVVSACRKATSRTMSVKLSPNVTDIAEIARAVEASGADALTLINSVSGMAIDIESRKPMLSNITGGMAGPAIKPIALKCVYQVHKVLSIPIIGLGGIMTGEDALEFMLAGASAVGVGFANFLDPTSTVRVIDEIETWCETHDVERVSDLIGALQC